jgi:hypothetical protein
MVERYLEKKITNWSSTQKLIIQPRAGQQLNAYYDRNSLKFFWGSDPVRMRTVYTSQSTDIVAHEVGHAILDSLRPDFYNVPYAEIWAFHEAFGDINSVLNTLQFDAVIDEMIASTDGNLRQSNLVSKLAEDMGTAVFNITKGKMGHTAGFLRNLVNNFSYEEPERLPKNGFDSQLSAQPHNFSRVFSGAWYDILVSMYEIFKSIMPAKEALIKARDLLGIYTFKAIPISPNTPRFYDAFARSMILIDKENGGEFNSLMNNCFISRNILKTPAKPFAPIQLNSVSGDIFDGKNVVSVTERNEMTVSLPNHMLNVELHLDVFYEFTDKQTCDSVVSSSPYEVLEHADFFVNFLKDNDMIRPDQQAPFEIDSDGNLLRSNFACGCINNAARPSEPEFLKPYKPENNAGCCGGGRRPSQVCWEPPVISVSCYTPPPNGCQLIPIEGGLVVNSKLTRSFFLLI